MEEIHTDEPRERPWEGLEELLDGGSTTVEIKAFLEGLSPGDSARCLDRLDQEHRDRVIECLDAEFAADLIEHLPSAQQSDLLEHATPDKAAAILEELPSDEQADLLTSFEPDSAQSILAEMHPAAAEAAANLAAYPADSAGGLMTLEFLAYPQSASAAEVIENLRRRVDEIDDYEVQYIYVVDDEGVLTGVLRLRDLLLARSTRPIRSFMIPEPVSVPVTDDLDSLVELFERKHYLGLPVVDADRHLVGLIHREAIDHAANERDAGSRLREQGIVGGEELRSMPLHLRARRRLSWLSVNVLLNVLAASVIAAYQDTLSAVIALAVFLPIISDMSGCSGNQAVAVSMRELSLGVVKPVDVFYVWRKEVAVGVINGLALGLLIALTAWLWQGIPMLGLVVGGALALNTLVAVSIGGVVPLLMKRAGIDPALASGPILTTLTDMCGFFLVLSFAAASMPYLVPT